MKPTNEQLATINSRLPGHELRTDDVEILPFVVFDSELTDRYTIMSSEMMAKLVQDLDNGLAAFNKLHESQSQLPVGASVSSRIVTDGDKSVLQANMYAALRRPDGTVFEEGKDLADRYNIGAVRACSAGVRVGFYKCNICGNDIRNWSDCDHIPGKTYAVDEEPKTCVALMTGHEIVDGLAQDCGIYEVSAVTAGGVAAAGSMSETFGKYTDGVDPTEFKKEALNEKGLDMRIAFSAAPQAPEEILAMEEKDVKKLMDEHYQPLKAENDSLKNELVEFKSKLDGQVAEFELVSTELETTKTALEATKSDFEALETELAEAKAAQEEAVAFKSEYIAIVNANGVKAGEEVSDDTFAGKTIDELKELNKGYEAAIALLPAGQQTGVDGDTDTIAALDDAVYKS